MCDFVLRPVAFLAIFYKACNFFSHEISKKNFKKRIVGKPLVIVLSEGWTVV